MYWMRVQFACNPFLSALFLRLVPGFYRNKMGIQPLCTSGSHISRCMPPRSDGTLLDLIAQSLGDPQVSLFEGKEMPMK
jgi:hypothetical protein